MTTIEEKLYEAIDYIFVSNSNPSYSDIVDEILPMITEQDRIARQEERERCIRIELGRECQKCSWGSINRGCQNYYIDFNPAKCQKWYQIRKAMEGGEV